ncbi:MAG: hypothetical protein WBV06_09030 [Acidimicrobiia bacterium]
MGSLTTTRRRVAAWFVALLALSACTSSGPTGAGSDDGATTVVPGGAGTTAMLVGAEEQPLPDLADLSLVDNLIAKEADGEWTRGEGLVATLGMVVGDVDVSAVLRYPELVEPELTGIVAMARDYLEDDSNTEARSDIARLLERLVFSGEQLDAMAGNGPQALAAVPGSVLAAAAFQNSDEDCQKFFATTTPAGVSTCLEERDVFVLDVAGEGPYRVYVPAPEMDAAGWTEDHYQLAVDALLETVPVYTELPAGEDFAMPPVNLVFSVAGGGGASAMADPVAGGECGIVLFTELLKPKYTAGDFKQVVAHELGHCYQTERFPAQDSVRYEDIRWREEGMANLLSNIVYPANDLEWDPGTMSKLAQHELETSLFDRAYTNSIFFQHLLSTGSIESLFDLVASLPTDDGMQLQKDAMAGYPGMIEKHHEYAQTVTDEMIVDSSQEFGDYAMTDDNFPEVEVTNPGTVLVANLVPFQLARRHVVVPPGKQACLTWDDSNFIVTKRDHPIGPNQPEWSPLLTMLPPVLEESGDVALVVTARNPGTFSLVAESVHDLNEETDGELVGTWVVQNTSLWDKVGYIAPVQNLNSITGRITVTFKRDGTVDIAYDGFSVSGDSTVNLAEGAFSSDFSRTYSSVTDAEGSDGYELTGDYVFYDHLSESDFLTGTATVSETSRGVFLGVKTENIELDTKLPDSTVDTYPANGWGVIGAANQVRFACGGHILLLDDTILRRVDS